MRHFLLVAATAAAVLAGPAAGFAQTAAAPGCPTAKVVTASGGYGGQQAQNLTGNGSHDQQSQNLTGNGRHDQQAQNLTGNGRHDQTAQNLTGNGYGPRLASGEAPCQ